MSIWTTLRNTAPPLPYLRDKRSAKPSKQRAKLRIGFALVFAVNRTGRPSPRPGLLRSSQPRTASSGIVPLHKSPRRPPCRSFAASRRASHRRAGSAAPRGPASNLATPEMGTATSFHRNDTGRQLAEKLQHLGLPQLLTDHCATRTVLAMQLKNTLC